MIKLTEEKIDIYLPVNDVGKIIYSEDEKRGTIYTKDKRAYIFRDLAHVLGEMNKHNLILDYMNENLQSIVDRM